MLFDQALPQGFLLPIIVGGLTLFTPSCAKPAFVNTWQTRLTKDELPLCRRVNTQSVNCHIEIPMQGSKQALVYNNGPCLFGALDPGNFDDYAPPSPYLIAAVALVLGVGAQGFINSMLQGDRGLGAFLSDGKGFGRSNFQPRQRERSDDEDAPLSGPDPLPWLKLPKLDFVEVAGQQQDVGYYDEALSSSSSSSASAVRSDDEESVVVKLESLQRELQEELGNGNIERATNIQGRLESLMRESGFDYKPYNME